MTFLDFFRDRRGRAQELFDEAVAALRGGDLGHGEMLLAKVLELSPDNAPALLELATVHFNQRRLDSAIALISRCIALDPSPSSRAFALRGGVRYEKGDFAGAVDDLDAALRANPGDVEILLSRAAALHRIGDHVEELASYERAMRLAPDDARPYFNRGILRSDSDAEGAIADFSAAIERDKKNAQAVFGRGFLRRARGERREALQDLQRAVFHGGFENYHLAVEWVRELHRELAEAGGPPVQGLRATWIEGAATLSEMVAAQGTNMPAPADTAEGGDLIVPPGHKVNVLHPSSKTCFARTESGVVIAQLGSGAEAVDVVARAALLIPRGEPVFLVWILQPAMLDSATIFDRFMSAFTPLVERSRGTLDHCAVVPHADERHRVQMKRLAELGISVHHAAADGACFVEIHRPDGIVIGIPGSGFSAADVPRDIDTLIADIADHQKPDDYAELFHRLPSLKLVFPVVGGHADLPPPGERGLVADGANIEVPLVIVHDLEVVLSFTSGAHPGIGGAIFEMDGEEALRMVLEMPGADGLLIQSTGKAWLVIPRDRIPEVLAPGMA